MGTPVAQRQRKAAHKQRKAATLRKEARRFKDGLGKQRRAALKEGKQ